VRLGQVNDRDVPGPVVSPGGAWIGVPHGALEVAERPAGIEVQRREGVSYHARSQVAGQVARQAGPCGEVAHDPPYVGGKQPPPRPGGEQHRDVCQIGSPGEIGVYPGSSRAGAGENLLRRPAAARTIGRYGGRRSGAMSGSRRSPQEGGPAPAGLEFAAALLPLWGFPPGTGIAPAGEQGTNNRTFLVRRGQQRYVLRVSGFLSAAEVRAEHQILQRLRQGGLPLQVPEPVAAPDGRTVIGTPAGPAAVCRWLPGTGGLPAQVIHGDLAPSNVLADQDTGEVTGLLDFELAGAGFRVQDILAALYNSTALGAPDWPRRTAAFLRGCASVRRLEPAEITALPELLIARSLGSALWRAARWRAGLGRFGEVTAHAGRLEATTRWLAANEDAFLSLAAAANTGS
jgi:Ser/Thr protein kinase RdoA (MazF antagonist)